MIFEDLEGKYLTWGGSFQENLHPCVANYGWRVDSNNVNCAFIYNKFVAEFKEFKRRFKFKPRLKYGWFHLKLYQMFQDLSRRLL